MAAGHSVAVLGTGAERDLVQSIVDRAGRLSRRPERLRGLAQALDLSALVGVLARSAVVVANDSGPRHIAQAVGTPTVSIFWCGNMINAGPCWRGRHRPHISWTVACPGCGRPLTAPEDDTECADYDSWVADVPVAAVLADVDDIMAATSPPRNG